MRIIKRGKHLKPLKRAKEVINLGTTKKETRLPRRATESTKAKTLSEKRPDLSRKKISMPMLIYNDRVIAFIKKSVCHYPPGLTVAETGAINLWAQKQGCYAVMRHPTVESFENDDENNRLLKKLDKVEPFTIENARENGVLYYKGQLIIAATGFRHYAELVHDMLKDDPNALCKGDFKDCPSCAGIRVLFEEWGVA